MYTETHGVDSWKNEILPSEVCLQFFVDAQFGLDNKQFKCLQAVFLNTGPHNSLANGCIKSWGTTYNKLTGFINQIWMFPEMGLPLDHPAIRLGFVPNKNLPAIGDPPLEITIWEGA